MENSSKNGETKKQILNATVNLLKQGRINDITVRKVASLAGANIGAINYHFGTKEKLVEEAIWEIFHPVEEVYKILDDNTMEPKARLRKFLTAITKHIIKTRPPMMYYAMIKNIIPGKQENIIRTVKHSILVKLIKILREITGVTEESKLTIMAFQLISAVMLPNLMFYPGMDMDVPSPEKQIDILLEHIK